MKDNKKLDPLIIINFDTLAEVLKKMQLNNDRVMDRLNEVNGKFIRLTNHQEDIDNLKYKMETIQTKITNADDSSEQYAGKFIEIDTKFQLLNNTFTEEEAKRTESDKWIKSIEDKVALHDNSLNNLNRVVDGNAKAFEKEKEHTSPLFTDVVNLDIRVQKTEETIQNLADLQEENFKKLELMTEFLDNSSKEQKHKVFKKLNDHERRTNTVIEKVNLLTENVMKINQGQQLSNGNNQSKDEEEDDDDDDFFNDKHPKVLEEQFENNAPINFSRCGKSKVNEMMLSLEEFKLEYNQYKQDNEKVIKALKDQIAIYESNNQNFIRQQEEELMQEDTNRDEKQPKMIVDPIKIIHQEQQQPDPIKGKQILDTIRLIASSVESKASKQDVANTQQGLSKELEKVTSKLESIVLKFDSKIALLANQFNANGRNIDPDALADQLNNQIKAVFKASAQDVIQNHISKIDFTPNYMIDKAIKATETHTDELNKAFESLVEIRKCLLSKSVEDNVIDLLCRMESIEKSHEASKAEIDCINYKIEGDPKAGNNDYIVDRNGDGEYVQRQIKDEGHEYQEDNHDNIEHLDSEKIPSILKSIEMLNSKSQDALIQVDKLEKKQVEIHKNILLMIKQDLRNESNRIFDEFKVNLKSSLARIEDQLREKVDKFNLNEFTQKLDSKFNHEIRHKLDKGDLNKNNLSIQKKIDSLEDKMSKALVDTLIDLQIEEAPLLIKKNLKAFDRCASCNQILINKRNRSNVHNNNCNCNSCYINHSTIMPISSIDNNNSNNNISNVSGSLNKRKQIKYGIKDKLPDISSN